MNNLDAQFQCGCWFSKVGCIRHPAITGEMCCPIHLVPYMKVNNILELAKQTLDPRNHSIAHDQRHDYERHVGYTDIDDYHTHRDNCRLCALANEVIEAHAREEGLRRHFRAWLVSQGYSFYNANAIVRDLCALADQGKPDA